MHICKTDKYSFDCSDNTRSPGWLLYPRWRDDAAIERRSRKLSRQVYRVNGNAEIYIYSSIGILFCFSRAGIFYLTHVRLHLLDRPIERIGYLPRRHDCEIDSQQYPDYHKQLVIFYHLDEIRANSLHANICNISRYAERMVTFLLSFTSVNMECTRHVFENMEPKANEKPAISSHALAVQMYGNAATLDNCESSPRKITLL